MRNTPKKMKRIRVWVTTFIIIATLTSCSGKNEVSKPEKTPQVPQNTPVFRLLEKESGFDFTHSLGTTRKFWIPETVTGGAALFDYDNDGDLDIYCVQAGGDLGGDRSDAPGNRLFRNDGQLKFTDVTATAGVGDQEFGLAATCADIDRDGNVDLFVSNRGSDKLFLNKGDGTFKEIGATSGMDKTGLSASAAFRDLDGDRLPELFVTQYVLWSKDKELNCGTGIGKDYCSPNNYSAPAPDRLYKNLGSGKFEDISEKAGLRTVYGNGLGVVLGDLDNDGRVDIYVANDGSPNQWWKNEGQLSFKDHAVSAGCAVNMNGVAEAGMGVQASDVDDDGDLDLFMTHIRNETNTWYRNDGGIFTDATIVSGMARTSRDFTGFGMGYFDFDSDGFLDLYVANGKVLRQSNPTDGTDPYVESNQLFRGSPGAKFSEVFPRAGIDNLSAMTSRGVAFGDLDNDGDVDLLVMNSNGPARIFVNESTPQAHSVTLELLDSEGIFAEGSRIKAKLGDRTIWRMATRNYSYCVANDHRLHIGLGKNARLEDLEIFWPDGTSSSFPVIDPADKTAPSTVKNLSGKLHVIRQP